MLSDSQYECNIIKWSWDSPGWLISALDNIWFFEKVQDKACVRNTFVVKVNYDAQGVFLQ